MHLCNNGIITLSLHSNVASRAGKLIILENKLPVSFLFLPGGFAHRLLIKVLGPGPWALGPCLFRLFDSRERDLGMKLTRHAT